MIPPRGFRAEMYPLVHQFNYSMGLSLKTAAASSGYMTLVKNYKSVTDPATTLVNPHHANHDVETGAICAPMSIIDKLRLTLKFNLTEEAILAGAESAVCQWTPVFGSFKEKWDAADDSTTTTVKDILELLTDATEEDVTPLFNNTKHGVVGDSDGPHPVSTVNLVETFGILNMDTDLTSEGVTFNKKVFHDGLRYYSNKGALKAVIGSTRNVWLTRNRPMKTFYINKFVPRPIRRIMPYTYFGILIHVPLDSSPSQHYYSGAMGVNKPDIGIKGQIYYHEWNTEHEQDMN